MTKYDVKYDTVKPPVDPKNPSYYLDKLAFHDALKAYKDKCADAEDRGEELPRVPEFIGECLQNIARGYAQKHNFRNYSYVNDMIGDAVITCLRYLRSYDPDRRGADGNPTSALSYFTQTCHYSFIARIAAEKKQTKVKRALIMDADMDTFSLSGDDAGEEFSIQMNEFIASLGTDDDELDKKIEKENEKKKQKPGPLEEFFE